jgi:uncharacterized protein YdiU (UPF0061 family)
MALQPGDAERTARAIEALPRSLQALLALPEDVPAPERLHAGLHVMAARMAAQMAAARALRLMHGAINGQNVALDGGWIDFGTVSAVSDYGRIIIARHAGDFRNDHTPLLGTLADLSHYLRRYLPAPLQAALPGTAQLQQAFRTVFEQRVAIEFVKLSGIPEGLLAAVDPALVAAFHAELVRIPDHAPREPFKLSPDHEREMPERMGALHLNTVMGIAACAADADRMEAALRAELPLPQLRARFVASLVRLREACCARLAPERRSAAQLFFALNAARLNSPLAALHRPVLDAAIERAIAEEAPLAPFIESTVAEARARRAPARDDTLELAPQAQERWSVSLARGVQCNGTGASALDCLGRIAPALPEAVRRHDLEALCRTPT